MSAFTRLSGFPLDFTAPAVPTPFGIIDWTPGQAARSFWKRAFDATAAGLGLLILAPALALIALLVRCDSAGPALFRQRRTGLGGREFTCWKFRTMVPEAESRLRELEGCNEAAGGVLFKMKSDPRITRLGSFLRRSSLDELPQLWNVLVGEMSLVGPRPLQLRDSDRLAKLDYDGYTHRLTVLPGITGAWQVAGRSSIGSDGMLRLDIDYVNDWSIRGDLGILRRTVAVVLTGKGAC